MARNFKIRHELKNINFENKLISWAKQRDANSCGYCLIHNSNNYLNLPNFEGDPESIYKKINLIRVQNDLIPKNREEMLNSFDLEKYYKEKGYSSNIFTNPIYDKKEIAEIIEKNNFDLIYTTSRNHYRGLIQRDQNNLYLLDSLHDSPHIISKKDAISMAHESLGNEGVRINSVGVLKRTPKKFYINS